MKGCLNFLFLSWFYLQVSSWFFQNNIGSGVFSNFWYLLEHWKQHRLPIITTNNGFLQKTANCLPCIVPLCLQEYFSRIFNCRSMDTSIFDTRIQPEARVIFNVWFRIVRWKPQKHISSTVTKSLCCGYLIEAPTFHLWHVLIAFNIYCVVNVYKVMLWLSGTWSQIIAQTNLIFLISLSFHYIGFQRRVYVLHQ